MYLSHNNAISIAIDFTNDAISKINNRGKSRLRNYMPENYT